MPEPKWSLRGEYMESCNCDYLCPCIYTNPQEAATHDHCVAVMVFRIDEGYFGETKLDGLKFALVIRSGRFVPCRCGISVQPCSGRGSPRPAGWCRCTDRDNRSCSFPCIRR